MLLYQDFNEQFEGHTQLSVMMSQTFTCCYIRISMNNLKDIHNNNGPRVGRVRLLYQDFNEQFEGHTQRFDCLRCKVMSCYIRISMNNLKDIHNICKPFVVSTVLLYQDFNEQFEGHTQPRWYSWSNRSGCYIRISMNNLKDIHNYTLTTPYRYIVVILGFQ